ncbi:hypothetical protein [uncultured Gimesia sp.]|uniref:hypothetical protein n=1 Tax=uncultured Gimesia sp. TaxID=1678688 RepID=UPI0030D99E57|tara:strand:+ start:45413 stop:45856 length:444 start_codon:yes stop_codon:yes gene_type:complete
MSSIQYFKWNGSRDLVILLLFCSTAGCGGSGSDLKKYHYSGTVTFDGKPVPVGYISFEPDSEPGPGSMAKISEGYYQTLPEKGLLGGPYKIFISGFDGKVDAGELGDGTPIFVDYTLKQSLPEENTTLNFDITSNDIKHTSNKKIRR